jgi:hypothetical protein
LDPFDAAWEQWFAKLVAYKEANGHCKMGIRNPLGIWCSIQRNLRKKKKLCLERIARLEAIGFCWDLDSTAWEQKFSELVAYKEVHGHCNVPNDGSPLGNWCINQRQRKDRLSPEQIARLEAIGFSWDPHSDSWENMFALLVAYKESHGHCNVPQATPQLGGWCNNQRNRKDKLSQEQIARLDAIGFCWDPKAAIWNQRIAELIAYKKANGHCNVPNNGSALGNWCIAQRQFRKKNKLSPQKIAQLDAIGFCWSFKKLEPAYKAAA